MSKLHFVIMAVPTIVIVILGEALRTIHFPTSPFMSGLLFSVEVFTILGFGFILGYMNRSKEVEEAMRTN